MSLKLLRDYARHTSCPVGKSYQKKFIFTDLVSPVITCNNCKSPCKLCECFVKHYIFPTGFILLRIRVCSAVYFYIKITVACALAFFVPNSSQMLTL